MWVVRRAPLGHGGAWECGRRNEPLLKPITDALGWCCKATTGACTSAEAHGRASGSTRPYGDRRLATPDGGERHPQTGSGLRSWSRKRSASLRVPSADPNQQCRKVYDDEHAPGGGVSASQKGVASLLTTDRTPLGELHQTPSPDSVGMSSRSPLWSGMATRTTGRVCIKRQPETRVLTEGIRHPRDGSASRP